MAKFECNLCGKCCQSFGEFIKIERQVNDRDYFCRYGITNELFQVHVLPEFAEEIDEEFTDLDEKNTGTSHKGCIFLRKNPEGKGFVCAVYPTRPSVCKEFLCYRMLIHHLPSGELRGRVIGINELKTQDEILAAIWMEKIAHIPHPFASQHAAVQHSHSPGAEVSHGHDSHLLAHIHGVQHAEDHEWVANVITILASHGYHAEKVE
jgi:uncharacterized protein